MDTQFISFLYPNEELRSHYMDPNNRPHISSAVCEELGLLSLIRLKNSSLEDFFVSDESTIAYRQSTFKELNEHPELVDLLNRLVPILCDISELRKLKQEEYTETATDSYLYSITEIELYVHAISAIKEGLDPLKGDFHSAAFLALQSFISELTESEYYKELNERLLELSRHTADIRSLTIGVNLDQQFRPVEAGILSINSDYFRGGTVLDKILRMSFKNDAMTTIAPLTSTKKAGTMSDEAMTGAIHEALEYIFHNSVRQWKAIVELYVLEKTDFLLKLLPEMEFLTKAHDAEKRLKDRGYTLVCPQMAPMEDKEFEAPGLFNPSVALQIEDEIVPNDFIFDDKARIYVLTGPNRGGKSVLTCAVGIAQCMFQLGMGIAAESCKISPVDGIYTHFPQGAEDTIDKGRLGEECARLRTIFESITENSMVLLDESLSSTGAYEASYIAGELLQGLSLAHTRAIFSTHLHDLAAQLPEIQKKTHEGGGVPIDTLVAGIEEGRRSFVMTRTKPDGKSYAQDIAEKYGLSLSGIEELLKRNAK